MNTGIGTCLLMVLLALAYAIGCFDTPIDFTRKWLAAQWKRIPSPTRGAIPPDVSGRSFFFDELEINWPERNE